MREPNPGRDAARGPRHAGTAGGHRSAGSPKPLRRSCRPVLPVWRETPRGTKNPSSPLSAPSSRRFRCRPMFPPRPRYRSRIRAPHRSAHPGCERDARQQRIPDFDGVPPPLSPGSSFRYRPLPAQTFNEHRSPRAGGTAGGGRGGGHGGAEPHAGAARGRSPLLPRAARAGPRSVAAPHALPPLPLPPRSAVP